MKAYLMILVGVLTLGLFGISNALAETSGESIDIEAEYVEFYPTLTADYEEIPELDCQTATPEEILAYMEEHPERIEKTADGTRIYPCPITADYECVGDSCEEGDSGDTPDDSGEPEQPDLPQQVQDPVKTPVQGIDLPVEAPADPLVNFQGSGSVMACSLQNHLNPSSASLVFWALVLSAAAIPMARRRKA